MEEALTQAEQEKRPRAVFKWEDGRRLRHKKLWRLTKCALCGQDSYHHPKMGLEPHICALCNQKHKQYIRQLGLGAGTCQTKCCDCGKPIVATVANKDRTRCLECKEAAAKRKAEEAKENREPQVNTFLRDKFFYEARYYLALQHPYKFYERAMEIIQQKLYKPGWWQSPAEIVVAAELIRQGYRVKPQKEIGSHRVDFYLPELNLVIEVDGLKWHGTSAARMKDKVFDARAILAGYSVTRISAKKALKDVRDAVDMAIAEAMSAEDYKLQEFQARYAGATEEERGQLVLEAAAVIEEYHAWKDRKRYAITRRGGIG